MTKDGKHIRYGFNDLRITGMSAITCTGPTNMLALLAEIEAEDVRQRALTRQRLEAVSQQVTFIDDTRGRKTAQWKTERRGRGGR